MTQDAETVSGAVRTKPAASGRFDQTSIILHWLTVLLILVQFSTAWLLDAVNQDDLAAAIFDAHQSSGALIWIVSLARLVWRRRYAYLPPFPERMPKLQQTIAKTNEYGLYVLLLVQPVTGFGRVLFRGEPLDLFIWQVPLLFARNEGIRHIFVTAHEFGANALVALIGLHAGAALFHRLILRDGVLQRMLPWSSQPVGASEAKPQPVASELS